MTRGRAVRLGFIMALVVTGCMVVALWRHAARDSWQARLAVHYVPPGAPRTKTQQPASFWARHDRVMGDILQRPTPWGVAELDELRGYIAQPMNWSNLAGPREFRTDDAANEYLAWLEAVNAIGARLINNAPINPIVRPAFEHEVTSLLDHTVGFARNQGIALVSEMGLLDRPGPVRSKVESMRTDPDPEVAANAIRKLEWRDLLVKQGMVK